jgi:hypothetical protein
MRTVLVVPEAVGGDGVVAVARQMRTAVDQEHARAILGRTSLRDGAAGEARAYDQNVIDGHAAFDRLPSRKVFL